MLSSKPPPPPPPPKSPKPPPPPPSSSPISKSCFALSFFFFLSFLPGLSSPKGSPKPPVSKPPVSPKPPTSSSPPPPPPKLLAPKSGEVPQPPSAAAAESSAAGVANVCGVRAPDGAGEVLRLRLASRSAIRTSGDSMFMRALVSSCGSGSCCEGIWAPRRTHVTRWTKQTKPRKSSWPVFCTSACSQATPRSDRSSLARSSSSLAS
mmetsp:Transcript_62872/g.161853  ORF Transcript_62872/g.161853 Transcript_62872/m.161853 type:complete len:207 (-) Transcript_62872:619-1239(-)